MATRASVLLKAAGQASAFCRRDRQNAGYETLATPTQTRVHGHFRLGLDVTGDAGPPRLVVGPSSGGIREGC